jgi:hypothetical protein
MEEKKVDSFGSAFLCSLRNGGSICCVRAGLAGTKDKKHNEGGSDNPHDDVEQSGARKARFLLRWRGRRFHSRLDADRELDGGFRQDCVRAQGGYLSVWVRGCFAGILAKIWRENVVS